MEIYLGNSDFKNQSVIMVVFESSASEPIYVAEVKRKKVNDAFTTQLIGERIKRLMLAPYSFNKNPNAGMDLFNGLGEPNRISFGVLGYRKITEDEKLFWIAKISQFNQLSDLVKIIENS